MADPNDDATRYFHEQSDRFELIEAGLMTEDGLLLIEDEEDED